jgi:hypothetical protein
MTIIMPDGQPDCPVMDLATTDLADAVRSAPGRPCAAVDANPDDWFPPEPPRGHHKRQRETYEARARALCRFCPVEFLCLELALRYERRARGAGIWGGMAPWDRERLAAERERLAAAERGIAVSA